MNMNTKIFKIRKNWLYLKKISAGQKGQIQTKIKNS